MALGFLFGQLTKGTTLLHFLQEP
ncbi:hypothetical protein MESS2_1680016 [Mesorhizobium metallidurans STM 2683]|uniref:Uncharacterized protein n=5 Tax=Mesorhizobium TaxID=68287 RepID=A0A1R3V4C2_9HYPH|nr:conserved hypothetical protein [Mesorhizobium ventifaucium]CAH2398123.1 conserved hypothetical protein [Mesorhizobium escarrei]CCV05837.1 hypothetical protein MESS2_1680016 [Mesorhizobium metallidurans STM 2683]SIT54762.1 conserved hypothetical protein [Mesorhizobium prunaredense]SJM31926.1 conserved hypothetical protein [Mesorhizobium delmotii]